MLLYYHVFLRLQIIRVPVKKLLKYRVFLRLQIIRVPVKKLLKYRVFLRLQIIRVPALTVSSCACKLFGSLRMPAIHFIMLYLDAHDTPSKLIQAGGRLKWAGKDMSANLLRQLQVALLGGCRRGGQPRAL